MESRRDWPARAIAALALILGARYLVWRVDSTMSGVWLPLTIMLFATELYLAVRIIEGGAPDQCRAQHLLVLVVGGDQDVDRGQPLRHDPAPLSAVRFEYYTLPAHLRAVLAWCGTSVIANRRTPRAPKSTSTSRSVAEIAGVVM